MKDVNSISKLRLSDFLPKEIINEQDFTYGDINGIAEVFGWQVVFFRDRESVNCTTAINVDNAESSEELSMLLNRILAEMHIELKVGDSFEKVVSIFGKPISYDEVLSEIRRYYFLLKDNNCLLSFGIHNRYGLVSTEIITNDHIVKGIINDNWRY